MLSVLVSILSCLGKPQIIKEYNDYMGGVDLNDQLCSYYKVGRASRKWWKYVVFFLVNISITNAWILWKKGNHNPPMKSTYRHKQFRTDLADFLRGGFTSRKITMGVKSKVMPKGVVSVCGHSLVKMIGRSRQCRQCSAAGRRTNKGYKKETVFKCHVCDLPLCKYPCFLEFHRAQNPQEEWQKQWLHWKQCQFYIVFQFQQCIILKQLSSFKTQFDALLLS